MGFNNDGAEVVARRLAKRARQILTVCDSSPDLVTSHRVLPVVGVNIGKTKVVSEDDAIADYRRAPSCWRRTPTIWSSM